METAAPILTDPANRLSLALATRNVHDQTQFATRF